MPKRKTKKDYHTLAASRGFKWVGGELPKTTHVDTWWECRKGHKWEARYTTIQQGHGCLICSGNARKTKKDYYELADICGFKWIDTILPKNIVTGTWWECKKGHRWRAVYNKLQQGHRCPICNNRILKTKKNYHELARTCGFKWVDSKLPKGIKDPTLWECKKGHRWKARYNNIQQGSGCPTCKDRINGVQISKPQRKLSGMLYGNLNYPEGRYRIDVAIMRKSQKIAVEYDCSYWHKGKETHDTKRDKYLISRGWKIIHIKSEYLLPTRKQLSIAIDYLLETNNILYNLYLEDWKF